MMSRHSYGSSPSAPSPSPIISDTTRASTTSHEREAVIRNRSPDVSYIDILRRARATGLLFSCSHSARNPSALCPQPINPQNRSQHAVSPLPRNHPVGTLNLGPWDAKEAEEVIPTSFRGCGTVPFRRSELRIPAPCMHFCRCPALSASTLPRGWDAAPGETWSGSFWMWPNGTGGERFPEGLRCWGPDWRE